MKWCKIIPSLVVSICLLFLVMVLLPNYQAQANATTANAFSPADLVVTKSDSPDPVQVSGTLTYTIIVNNDGPAGALDVQLTDTLPSGVTFVSAASSQGSCSGTALVVCALGNLSNGSYATVTIVVTAPATVGMISNSVTIAGSQPDPHQANNTDVESTTVVALDSADLSVIKTGWPNPVLINSTLTYAITVTNRGPAAVGSVRLTDTLPTDVVFVSAVPGQGTCGGTGPITCDLGSLANGDYVAVTLVVTTPGAAGMIANTVSVASSQPDHDETNNTDIASIIVATTDSADLAVRKTDWPDPVFVSGTLTYAITITNRGPAAANGVALTDTLPSSVTLVSVVPGQGTCNGIGLITCSLGTLANGDYVTVTIVVTAPAAVGTINNTVNVASSQPDPHLTNNGDAESTWVIADDSADLSVNKTDWPDPVAVSGTLTFVITVSNHGPSTASDVRLTDTLPSGVTLVSVVPGQGTCSGTEPVVCSLGSLADGAQVTVLMTTIAPGVIGLINNTASVASSQPDPRLGNNSDTESTTVAAADSADLSVVKDDSADPVLIGSQLGYTITVTNHGPAIATGVRLTDTLPSEVSLVSAVPDQGTCSGTALVVCELGGLARGDQIIVTVIVTAPATGGIINNVVSVMGDQTDPNPANDMDTESTKVAIVAGAELGIDKADLYDPVQAGTLLTYLITVTNQGTIVATGVLVTDTLPAGATFISAIPSQGNCSGATVIVCSLGSLDGGSQATITLAVRAPDTAGVINNTAAVKSAQVDPDPTNNSDVESTGVITKLFLPVVLKNF